VSNGAAKRPLFWLSIGVLFFIFLFLIRSILLPFVLGIFTAYFLDPAADRLEKAGLSRGASTLVITACFFLGILLISVLIAPVLASQLSGLIAAMPEYASEFEKRLEPQMTSWLGNLPMVDMNSLKDTVSNFSGVMVKFVGGFIAGVFMSGMAFVNLLSLVLITPVVAFYLLRDWDNMTLRIDNLLPRAHAHTIRTQMLIIDRTLAGFVRGQLNVCLLLAAYYAIGLSLVGLKFGIVIGIVTGFLVIFPYVGLGLGTLVGLGVAFFQFQGYSQVAVVLAVFVSGQVIEANFVTPKLVGEKVGLHPVWIIFGMLSGAALFGFVGILLAVPITAVVGVLIRFALQTYLSSDYYQGERPIIAP
jgi:predicted PurR-regulated permease PerM